MELELVFNWVIKSSIMASILAALILLVKYALRTERPCTEVQGFTIATGSRDYG
ncbi:MAG: hypothetical protein P4L49_17090 [Desulfosporosinus sp.]|nr:hypothetical protein [Desulfosporosinus sp.]